MGMIDERERHDLHTWAVDTMGENRADIFMRSLPPHGWDALATKEDVEDVVARHAEVLRREFATKEDVEDVVARHVGNLRQDHTRDVVRLVLAFAGMTAAALIGDAVIPHWLAPAPPQIILQMPDLAS